MTSDRVYSSTFSTIYIKEQTHTPLYKGSIVLRMTMMILMVPDDKEFLFSILLYYAVRNKKRYTL